MKEVKIVAMVDGEVAVIGKCHPGQARMMKKSGIGKWKDGKVWLQSASDMEVPQDPDGSMVNVHVEGADPKKVLETIKQALERSGKEWPFPQAQTSAPRPVAPYVDWLAEDVKEIDPEGLLIVRDIKHGPKNETAATILGFVDFTREFVARKIAGHKTFLVEDPRDQEFGFVDENDGDVFVVRMRDFEWGRVHLDIREEWLEPLGLTISEYISKCRDHKGREEVFGGYALMNTPEWEVLPEPEVTLDSLWESAPENHPSNERMPASMPVLIPRGRFPGWTPFRYPDCREQLPVFDLLGNPYPCLDVKEGTMEEIRLQGVEGEIPLMVPVLSYEGATGVFRRVRDRLLMVWDVSRDGWEEAVLQEDSTYQLLMAGRAIDSWRRGDGTFEALAPSSFEDQVAAAEVRVQELLGS